MYVLARKTLTDDSGREIAVGKQVVIVEFLGETHCIFEAAWPDETLVGGFDFSVGTCELTHLEPVPDKE